jgi:uncharacterized protein YlxP (DUF503 family)
MFVGSLALDLLLGDVHSLKEKRSVVRPVIAVLKRLDVAVAEAGHLDLHRRALVGVAVVAADARHCPRCSQPVSAWSLIVPRSRCSRPTRSCTRKGTTDGRPSWLT